MDNIEFMNLEDLPEEAWDRVVVGVTEYDGTHPTHAGFTMLADAFSAWDNYDIATDDARLTVV